MGLGYMLGLPTGPMSMNGALVPIMFFPPSLRFSRLLYVHLKPIMIKFLITQDSFTTSIVCVEKKRVY